MTQTATQSAADITSHDTESNQPLFSRRSRGVHARVFENVHEGNDGEYSTLDIIIDRAYRSPKTGEIEHSNRYRLEEAMIARRLLDEAINAALVREEELKREHFAAESD